MHGQNHIKFLSCPLDRTLDEPHSQPTGSGKDVKLCHGLNSNIQAHRLINLPSETFYLHQTHKPAPHNYCRSKLPGTNTVYRQIFVYDLCIIDRNGRWSRRSWPKLKISWFRCRAN